MHHLTKLLGHRIASGLKRKSITRCSQWAEYYRVMGSPFPGKWSFLHHPWAKEMHDCDSDMMVGQKAAQLAFTEVALNKSFYAIDIHGVNVLYVLPAATPDAKDFSTSRFDPALEASAHLKNLFTDVKNVGHKRAGNANLFIRGSRSRSQLKSTPAALIILDEVDEMNQKNISLVFERTSGQLNKQIVMISTPTIDKYGVNFHYRQTSQEHYFFKCPHCSKWTELTWPDCLVITAEGLLDASIINTYLKCRECNHSLDHNTKIDWLSLDNAKWVASYTDRMARGFHINQMYSMTVEPYEIAQSYFRAQRDPADEQEFYNSKMGITHTVEGAKITENMIKDCFGDYTSLDTSPSNTLITIGIDVGTWLHYEVDQWILDGSVSSADVNIVANCRVLKQGKLKHFEELDDLLRKYKATFCVIDANPERRKAFEFAQRFYGYVRLCFYGRGVASKQIKYSADDELTMTVDRTSWMDMSLGRFKSKNIVLPRDTDMEYREQIMAPVRIYEKDSDGNPTGKYVTGHENDHYAHARTYAEIALQSAVSLARNENI